MTFQTTHTTSSTNVLLVTSLLLHFSRVSTLRCSRLAGWSFIVGLSETWVGDHLHTAIVRHAYFGAFLKILNPSNSIILLSVETCIRLHLYVPVALALFLTQQTHKNQPRSFQLSDCCAVSVRDKESGFMVPLCFF